MRWVGRRMSGNVEDRRGIGGGHLVAGGGVLGIVALLINYFLGGNGGDIQQQLQQINQQPLSAQQQASQDSMAQFVSVVLADCEDIWTQIFKEQNRTYTYPHLVL